MKHYEVASLVLGVLLAGSVALPVHAGELDGKRFDGILAADDGSSADPDSLVFEDDTFLSTACEQHGFGAVTYSAGAEGDAVVFEAHVSNENGQKMDWEGTLTGDNMVAYAAYTDSEGKMKTFTFNLPGAESDTETEAEDEAEDEPVTE